MEAAAHTSEEWGDVLGEDAQGALDDFGALCVIGSGDIDDPTFASELIAIILDGPLAAKRAALIAAAPALLAALEAVNFHDDHEDCRFCGTTEGGPHDPGATCSLIIAAIAEAHGEE